MRLKTRIFQTLGFISNYSGNCDGQLKRNEEYIRGISDGTITVKPLKRGTVKFSEKKRELYRSRLTFPGPGGHKEFNPDSKDNKIRGIILRICFLLYQRQIAHMSNNQCPLCSKINYIDTVDFTFSNKRCRNHLCYSSFVIQVANNNAK